MLALTVAACGSNGGSESSASSPPPSVTQSPVSTSGAEAAVAQAWETFFSGSSTPQQKIDHLQNGEQFAQVIQAQADSPLAKAASAKVSDVTVTGSSATVTYTVLFNGSPVLQDQEGQALLENGVWKVSAASFCQLLALENSVGGASGAPSGAPSGGTGMLPPACAGAASAAPGASAGASASP